jgi:Spy/CpxP family protein refolding chaperone
MREIKTLVISLAVITIVMGVSYAKDQSVDQSQNQGKEQWQKRHQQEQESMFKELNLTEEQKIKLAENRKTQQEQMKSLRAQMKEQYEKLAAALKAQGATRSSVQTVAEQLKVVQAQLINNRIEGIFAVKEILTPEQFTKFQAIMAEKYEKMKKNFSRHGKNRETR